MPSKHKKKRKAPKNNPPHSHRAKAKHTNKKRSSTAHKQKQVKKKLKKIQSKSIEDTENTKITDNKLITHNCGNCKKAAANKRCSGCNAVYYCNQDCQRKNWNLHKTQCKQCKSIKTCQSLFRVIEMLKWYKLNHTSKNDSFEKYIMNHKFHLINDYHHILQQHCNEFAFIYKLIQKADLLCNIRKCCIFKRNHTTFLQSENDNFEPHMSVYVDVIDSIHCYCVHSIDGGYMAPINNTTNDIRSKRNNLLSVRGKDRFLHNKFVTIQTIQNEEKQNEKKLDTEPEFVNDFYCFGERYNYSERTVDGIEDENFLISPKYNNIKEEVTCNENYSISIREFQIAHSKSEYLLKSSNYIKSLRITDINSIHAFDHIQSKNITIRNVLSVILYTDYDVLSSYFSSTWRQTKVNETLQAIAKRHASFWNWGKTLVETVNRYGRTISSFADQMVSSFAKIAIERPKFYHGMSRLYFSTMSATFNCPTSTSSRIQVAQLFAPNDGIIIELHAGMKNFNGLKIKYFNCSMFSRFTNEDERLFIQKLQNEMYWAKLSISVLIDVSSGINLKAFSQALRKFDLMIQGKELDNFMNQSQHTVLILSELILNIIKTYGEDCILVSGLLKKYKRKRNDKYIECKDDYEMKMDGKMLGATFLFQPDIAMKMCSNSAEKDSEIIRGKGIDIESVKCSKYWKVLNDKNTSQYALHLFMKWRTTKKEITVEMNNFESWPIRYPHKFRDCFIYPNSEMLMFDVMNLIFKNVETIICLWSLGKRISINELLMISKMIKNINGFTFSKLMCIQLKNFNNVHDVKLMILQCKKHYEKFKWSLKVVNEYDYSNEEWNWSLMISRKSE